MKLLFNCPEGNMIDCLSARVSLTTVGSCQKKTAKELILFFRSRKSALVGKTSCDNVDKNRLKKKEGYHKLQHYAFVAMWKLCMLVDRRMNLFEHVKRLCILLCSVLVGQWKFASMEALGLSLFISEINCDENPHHTDHTCTRARMHKCITHAAFCQKSYLYNWSWSVDGHTYVMKQRQGKWCENLSHNSTK